MLHYRVNSRFDFGLLEASKVFVSKSSQGAVFRVLSRRTGLSFASSALVCIVTEGACRQIMRHRSDKPDGFPR